MPFQRLKSSCYVDQIWSVTAVGCWCRWIQQLEPYSVYSMNNGCRDSKKAEFGLESLYASDSHSLSYVSLFCASLSKASVSLVQSRHLYESTLFTSSSWLTTIMADLLFLWQSTTSSWVSLILSFRWLSFSLKMIHLIILVNNFHSTKEYI